jgi:GNAT superfamily N-acetyltransferase
LQTKTTSNVRIRRAEDIDAETIASLMFEAFAEYESLYTPAGFAATAINAAQVVNRIAEGPVWVAVLDESIVGTASVMSKADSLYLRGMAVLPAARRLRIGELLLKHVEQFAVAGKSRRLILSTTPFLHRAIRLYEHFGFRRTNDGPHDLFGTPLFSMEKILSGTNFSR